MHKPFCVVVMLLILLASTAVSVAQSASPSASAQPAVPRLIRFGGSVSNGGSSGTVGLTFSLYNQQQGGTPLWQEVQNVQVDADRKSTRLNSSHTATSRMPSSA